MCSNPQVRLGTAPGVGGEPVDIEGVIRLVCKNYVGDCMSAAFSDDAASCRKLVSLKRGARGPVPAWCVRAQDRQRA